MLSTYAIYEQLKDSIGEKAAQALTHLLSQIYEDLQQTVTRADFTELKSTVHELAQAQGRTEIKLGELTGQVAELAQAQGRTEIKVGELTGQVAELAQAQGRTEIKVGELTEAQNRTEIKVGELTEAQNRTEIKVGELTEAQNRTEIKVGELTGQVSELTGQVGELAQAQSKTEVTVAELVETQKKTEEILQQHTNILQHHGDLLADLNGRTFESRVCEHAASHFGAFMRKIRRVDINDLYDMTESVLSLEEQDDLARVDMVVCGRALDTGDEIYAAVEISVTIDDYDLDRAERRAALLRKAGIKTVAVVLGSCSHPATIARAGQLGVAMLIDRVQHHWQAALSIAQ